MVDKGEIFACDELMDDIRNQNLARLRTSTNAEGGMDSCAEQATFRENRLAGVNPYADADGISDIHSGVLSKGFLHGYGARNRTGGREEGCFYTIASMGDLGTSIPAQTVTEDGIVDPKDLVCFRITQTLDEDSGAFYIGYENDMGEGRGDFVKDTARCRRCLDPSVRLKLRAKTMPTSICHRSWPVANTYLLIETAHVMGYRPRAHDEAISNFLICAALCDLRQDLSLYLAEVSWINALWLREQGYGGPEQMSKMCRSS